MIFNEPAYFIMLAVAVVAFRYLPERIRPWWLFGTGTLFYAYYAPRFVAVLLVETALVLWLGTIVRKRKRGMGDAFAAGLILTIGVLVFFKYRGFVAATVMPSNPSGLPSFEDLAIPLAISFFTFEFIHYLVDAKKGTLPEHDSADFLAFAMFAPTMVAGPIKRFQGFHRQAREARANPDDVYVGTTRILIGLGKKVILADTLTLWIAPIASAQAVGNATRIEIVAALIAYSFRIYFDFSGYSDIAIGSARLFGIHVPENFNWPYLKTNIADFWRSWHMSLMSWIRDYVYVPLGGSHVGLPRQLLNLVLAFTVSGIWHGAAWNFVGWGLYHGSLMAGYRVWRTVLVPRIPPLALSDPLARRALGVAGAVGGGLLTFALVTLGWGLFAMPLSRFGLMLQQLVTGGLQ